jgi:tetratricopeptide (TPR) repeat protein
VHAWKACVPKGTRGSNPRPSANALPDRARLEMIGPMRFLITLLFFASGLVLAEEKPVVEENSLEVARQSFQAENFVATHAALDRFEKTERPTAESLDLRGCVYMEQGKFDEATKGFEAAHNASPSVFTPRIHAGDLLLRQKKFSEARDIYETLLKEKNILVSNERLRFGVLMTYLGEHDEQGAQSALQRIGFPTQTPAYYYAQAAWGFAHSKDGEAKKWISAAAKIFDANAIPWFAYPLYELGWIKKKPPATLYQSI